LEAAQEEHVNVDRQGICDRIRKAREGAGLTQEQMAGLLELTPRAYQNYERTRVPWESLAQIARLTGCDLEWFLYGESYTHQLEQLEARIADLCAKS
jgi:transcriptional regulator with XRE-family HTH domain